EGDGAKVPPAPPSDHAKLEPSDVASRSGTAVPAQATTSDPASTDGRNCTVTATVSVDAHPVDVTVPRSVSTCVPSTTLVHDGWSTVAEGEKEPVPSSVQRTAVEAPAL